MRVNKKFEMQRLKVNNCKVLHDDMSFNLKGNEEIHNLIECILKLCIYILKLLTVIIFRVLGAIVDILLEGQRQILIK